MAPMLHDPKDGGIDAGQNAAMQMRLP